MTEDVELEEILTNPFQIVEYNKKTWIQTPLRQELVFLCEETGIKAVKINNGKLILRKHGNTTSEQSHS